MITTAIHYYVGENNVPMHSGDTQEQLKVSHVVSYFFSVITYFYLMVWITYAVGMQHFAHSHVQHISVQNNDMHFHDG